MVLRIFNSTDVQQAMGSGHPFASGIDSIPLTAWPSLGVIFSVLLIASVAPLFLVNIPALGDYLNHLSRTHVIATIDQNAILHKFFVVHRQWIPNQAVDQIIPFLTHFVSIYMAGKLFVGFTVILIVTGVFAIHRVIFRTLSVAPFLVFLFVYNYCLILGLLNYLFAVGLTLWGIAIWIALRDHRVLLRVVVSQCIVLVLYFAHLYAVGLYGLSLLCFEIWMAMNPQNKSWRWTSDLPAFGAPFVLILILFMSGPSGELMKSTHWFAFHNKARAFDWLFHLYYPVVDYPMMIIIGLSLVWAYRRGALWLHSVGWLILGSGFLVYLMMPGTLLKSMYADYRLVVPLGFVVIAFLRLELSGAAARHCLLLLAACTLMRLASVTHVWFGIDQVYTDIRSAYQTIEPGSAIMVARAENESFPFDRALPLNYVTCLATIDRSAFSETFFSLQGAQFVDVRPEFRVWLLESNTAIPLLNSYIAAARSSADTRSLGFRYAHWEDHFDYMLVLYTHTADPNPWPEKLTLVASGYPFQIYKIAHSPIQDGADAIIEGF